MTGPAAIAPDRAGKLLLRPARHYRLLIAVEGAIPVGQLDAVLERIGFADLGLTWPDDWPKLRPRDWPTEPQLRFGYPFGLVRGSGALFCGGAGVRFEPEIELGGGSFTLCRAWDLGPAERPAAVDETGAELEIGDAASAPGMSSGLKVAIASALGLGVWAVWSSAREEKRIDADAERYARLSAQAEAARLRARAGELAAGGMSASDAAAVAELESVERDDAQAQIVAAIAAGAD